MSERGTSTGMSQESGLLRRAELLFGAMVACFVVWIFTLPVFPTQDGPMHRYYIHVLDALLHHSRLYNSYAIRNPFPPYATHYFVLMELSHVVSYDMAEKLLISAIVVCFAYGLRFCAMGCGKAGNVLSFFAAPLLMHWALMMGFINYSLAISLFLFIAGCWERAEMGRRIFWIPFALLVCLVTVTHPVPLLILTALCLLDLLLRAVLLRRRARPLDRQTVIFCCCALAFCLLAFRIPAASMRSHATESIFADFGFHARSTAQFLLLSGVSPFYTLAHGILPNLYRLALYGIFAGAMLMGGRALLSHWREQRLVFSDTFFLSTIILALSIPVLPDYVNGSGYFATRMVVLLWVGALIAASGGTFRAERSQSRVLVTALAVACLSLVAAQVYFRPLARALHVVEYQPLPSEQRGLLLTGMNLDDYMHHRYQVAFDPLSWGPALDFVRSNDVMLDSPWLALPITPLAANPSDPLIAQDIRMTHLSQTDPGFRPNASLPRSKEPTMAHKARFLIYSDTPAELDQGLADQLMPADAALFQCARRAWYLVCLAR